MSTWTARFLALGARTADGVLVGRPTLADLIRQLPGTPVSVHWVDGKLEHPYVGARMAADRDPAAIIGSVLGARLLSDGAYGLLSINQLSFDEFFLAAERDGRLMETFGLSPRGRTAIVPRNGGEPLLLFTDLISLDVVQTPIGGGCLLQSDVAEAAGLACPVPPKLTPLPRPAPRLAPSPARENRGTARVRYERTEPRLRPLVTEFRVIPEGGDY
ncbi:MAG: hypothetical protein Q7W02_02310 [Candidatus Rokubacteria bacterium]|nr:hypothetical protein [Candidatus Rokubacteria bacterium]